MSAGAKNLRVEWFAVGVIFLIYILGLILFFPKIQYPYGDSWFYSRNVYDSIAGGKITFTNAQAATPIIQVWLGVTLCKLTGGFAFWKLNMLAYVFSLFAAIYTYFFIRLFTRTTSLALLGTVLLIAIPPFFKTSMAFMTDPFFYFAMVLAFYCGARYIGLPADETVGKGNAAGSRRYAFLAAIGFAIAILNRSNALLTYLAYLGYVIFYRKKFKFKPIDWGLHLIPLIAFTAFEIWLKTSGSEPYYLGIFARDVFLKNLYTAFTSREILPFVLDKIVSLAEWAGYLGVFLLPLTILLFARSWSKWRGGETNRTEPMVARIIWLVFAPVLVIVTLVLVSLPGSDVILPNTITEYGMGLKGVILPGAMPILGQNLFTLLQLIIIAGGFFLFLGAIGRLLDRIPVGPGYAFAWWILISTAIFPLLTHDFSDRYLIPIFPLLFVLLVDGVETKWKMPRWVWLFPVALIIGTGLLANEYFGWNTARWKAIDDAKSRGEINLNGLVDAERTGPLIDGGLEYTAFRYYNDAEFLKHWKLIWEEGKPTGSFEEGEFIAAPYIFWWDLPTQYEYIVRENTPLPGLEGPDATAEWKICGASHYTPFPWSKPLEMDVYKSNE